ncbi:hypothetical protein [Xanthomonas sp. SS]|uniref:hypothetical protein n=1 Tax=Xanthomonas sp. SS TaxID=2724122 RepID=UPI001C8DEDE6|nr:hypothetical protein [Xanthomonas sp. SS]
MNPVFAALGMMFLTMVALVASELSRMVDKIVEWVRHSAKPRRSIWRRGKSGHLVRPRR